MNPRCFAPPGLLALGFLLAACGSSEGSPSASPSSDAGTDSGATPEVAKSALARDDGSAVPEATLKAVADADNAFAFDLFAKVRADFAAKNAVVSPTSISLALSMTLAGAGGSTADEMAKVLHFDKLGPSAHAGNNALDLALESRADAALAYAKDLAKKTGGAEPAASDYRLKIVNSVWGDRSYTWETPFLDTLAKNYGAGVYLANFIDQFEIERVRINGWVSEQTQKKINDLLPAGSLDDATRMVLVNAIQLKMPWQTPFEKSFTKAGDFTRADGSKVTADFLNDKGYYSYFEDDKAQLAAIPLSGGKMSVVVALPKDKLETFESSLDAAYWANARTKMTSQSVALGLPKFNFTSASVKLKPVLQALGMKVPFIQPQADFFGMCKAPPRDERLFIGDVVHKAMMAVDEHGVEAAAATAVILSGGTSVPPEPSR